jgi:uncharacterized protein (TIGR03000 family)
MPGATESTATEGPATVLLKAPADVVVTVNGQVATRRSEEEEFQTPNLRPGYTYSYQFKAEAIRDGKKVTLERRVTVRAGQKSVVDFGSLATAEGRDVAKVRVIGPASARVIVNNVELGTVGNRPAFETPRLQPGRKYYYTIRAVVTQGGRVRTATQRVNVEAGKDVTVDFSELAIDVRSARR